VKHKPLFVKAFGHPALPFGPRPEKEEKPEKRRKSGHRHERLCPGLQGSRSDREAA
jgi:hypothetical protein